MSLVLLLAGLFLFVIGIALGVWHVRRGKPFFSMEVSFAEGRFVGAPAMALIIIGAGLMVAAPFFDTRSLRTQVTTLTDQRDGAVDARDLAIEERDNAVTARDTAETARAEASEAARLAVDAEERAIDAKGRAEGERDAANEALAAERTTRWEAVARANAAEVRAEQIDATLVELEDRFRDTILLCNDWP